MTSSLRVALLPAQRSATGREPVMPSAPARLSMTFNVVYHPYPGRAFPVEGRLRTPLGDMEC